MRTAKFFKSSVSRTEALHLYREGMFLCYVRLFCHKLHLIYCFVNRTVLRVSKVFHWCDEKGEPWNKRLRAEARKEFEQSKEETDPLIIARMLVTGRDCVEQIKQKFNEADRKCWERIENDHNRNR